MSSESTPAWFRRHFNEDYRILYAGRDQAQADLEVEFAVRRLGISPGEPVLDLCCGFGRHLAALRRHGITAVGLDLSRALLHQVPRGPDSVLVCADMRRLPFAGGPCGFAAVVNFFTSFGYFDADDENTAAVGEIARVLCPGGRFLIDLMNPESTLQTLEPRSERRAGPLEILEERRWDPVRRRVEKHITLRDVHSRAMREYTESVRLWSAEEIGSVLDGAGLQVVDVCGDFRGAPHGPAAPRMIVIGRRAG
jgi:SAM-dependent methyltransferase